MNLINIWERYSKAALWKVFLLFINVLSFTISFYQPDRGYFALEKRWLNQSLVLSEKGDLLVMSVSEITFILLMIVSSSESY